MVLTIRKTMIMLAMTLCCVTAMGARKKVKAPPAQPLTALQIVEKVNNHYQKTNAPETRAFWDDAVYQTGNMEAYKLTGRAQWLEYADKWARHNKWKGARCRNKKQWVNHYQTYGEDSHHVLFADWQACFQTYLDLNEMNPADFKIARTREVMDSITELRRPSSCPTPTEPTA